MNLTRFYGIALTCIVALLFTLWPRPLPAEGPLRVTVSILPQAYFVKKVAKDLVTVSVMVTGGSNPATYEPKPTQMTDLARSRLYFTIDVPFEASWLDKFKVMNPNMRVVHTDRGIAKRHASAHLHEPSAASVHPAQKTTAGSSGTDPHIWLSPPLVKKIAQNTADALIQSDPDHQAAYEENLWAFEMELDRLDQRIRDILDEGSRKRSVILVFHPSWGYFADRYGLKQVSMECEGKSPSAMEMVQLTRYAKKTGIDRIFVQPQFSRKRAEAMAGQIGAQVVIVDPLSENWEANLIRVANQFQKALE
ncbi:MAG: zinc ABC transporter substrate-binding protein [Deltaproteobacteria bacterium]|nr:zinc ABC transporter substrate-binding protein [Deltaproteobacteria bacterium]